MQEVEDNGNGLAMYSVSNRCDEVAAEAYRVSASGEHGVGRPPNVEVTLCVKDLVALFVPDTRFEKRGHEARHGGSVALTSVSKRLEARHEEHTIRWRTMS